MKHFIGLDAHSKQTKFVIVDENANELSNGSFASTPDDLREIIKKFDIPIGSVFAVEACSQAFWISRCLLELEMIPKVIASDEASAKKSNRNKKTDYYDARQLALGISKGIYERFVYVPSLGIQRLRSLYALRIMLMKSNTMYINAAKGKIRTSIPGFPKKSLSTPAGWVAVMKDSRVVPIIHELMVLREVWETCYRQIQEVERQIHDALQPHREVANRFLEINGVGELVAGAFIAAIGDPHRFPDAKKVGAYLGLVPRVESSGEVIKMGRISKQGPKYARVYLFMAALTSAGKDTPFSPLYHKVKGKTGIAKKGAISVAHKLCRIMWSMWKNGTRFEPAQFGVAQVTVRRSEKKKYVLLAK